MSETHLIEQAPSMMSGMELEEGMYQNQMDKRATESLLHTGEPSQTQLRQGQQSGEQKKSKGMPDEIVTYIERNRLNQVVKAALNKVLRERPADPFSALAGQLFNSASKSYPIFDRFEASSIYLNDNLSQQTIKILVYMSFKGRNELRHTHYFTYDESQVANFNYDAPDDKQGLQKTCKYINTSVSNKLKGIVVNSAIEADNILFDLITDGENDGDNWKNVVRSCSEALVYATAKCFSPQNVWQGFSQSFYPVDEETDGVKNTKLMMTIFNGGKAAGSAVKFSKFYLIVDAMGFKKSNKDPTEVLTCYQKFLAALKKGFAATKGGEASFKVLPDASFFNANQTVGESLKMIEDAITASGANEDERKVFQIGMNCDADNAFNKDPKDPNKYEQEGQKGQFDGTQMIEYYTKMLTEHPLITYIEDSFSQFDFPSHKALREKLSNELPTVNMGLKQLFSGGGLQRFKYVTDFQEFAGPKVDNETQHAQSIDTDQKDSKKGGKNVSTPGDKKKTPKGDQASMDDASGEFPASDPNDPNKNKVTPDCANIQMSGIQTMSQMYNYFIHASNLEEEQQFSLIIDDCTVDTFLFTEIIDMAIGIGAQYILLKGCQKNEKIQKLLRFAQIKSAQCAE